MQRCNQQAAGCISRVDSSLLVFCIRCMKYAFIYNAI